MCAQCMVGAVTATAAVTGVRAWMATRVDPRVLRGATVVLIAAGVLAAATFLSGA